MTVLNGLERVGPYVVPVTIPRSRARTSSGHGMR